ncbi:MAG: cupin domain-containing protein [Candidatus Eisenbacteria bacterium]
MESAKKWMDSLQLLPHPEGGWFREVYRSRLTIDKHPGKLEGTRSIATAIYYLLDRTTFSTFHRLASDEIWHFYRGDPIVLHVLHPNGTLEKRRLGPNIDAGESLIVVVEAGLWFAARIAEGGDWALVGCTTSPGFDPMDFELAEREELIRKFPQHRAVIESLLR